MASIAKQCHIECMTQSIKKRPRDPNQLAKMITDIATGEVEDRNPTPEEQGKDPHAVALGQKGGEKGGVARSKALSPERRKEIARRAALARWNKPKP
ncbi:MAG: histone H1 [Alphaproteobacteria bacterium]